MYCIWIVIPRGRTVYMFYFIALLLVWCLPVHADSACNNKYKNLLRLQTILKNDPYAKVPPFFEIASKRIEAQLSEPSGPDFYDLYYETLDAFMLELDIKKSIFALRSYTNRYYNKVKNLFRKGWRSLYTYEHDAFGEVVRKNPTIQEFVRLILENYGLNATSEEVDFLTDAQQKNLFLMVRSSGLEDSKTTANAGLYLSVPYVNPDWESVLSATIKVIESYFNPQALKNNLIAGVNLFNMPLCIPVLVQQLIGEPFGGTTDETAIPVSGVAFTTQSSLSAGNFKITEINASYGHGEGVVANRVAVDRYYVTESTINSNGIAIYPMITYKRQRLIPTGNGLQLIKNPDALIARPCLSTQMIERLYAVLKKIETAYGQPMDVEFVVLKGVIYIVQARPAMKFEQKPSYIPDTALTETQLNSVIPVNTLVAGSSQVVVVTDPDKLIIKDTLDDADADGRRSSAQAVFVGAWASSLSHAAVNFIGFGIPCFYAQDFNSIKLLAASISSTKPLVIDTQRQLVYLWNNPNKTVAQATVEGWYEHPIARSLSIIEGLLDYRIVRDSPVVPQDAVLVEKMSQLKNILGSGDQDKIYKEVVARIRDRVQITEKRIQRKTDLCDPSCNETFAAFKNKLFSVMDSFQRALDNKADRLELLFYHKILESLLYQENDGSAGVNQYTYRWFLDDLFIKQMLRGSLRTGGIMGKLLDYGKHCPDKELLEKWQHYIKQLDPLFLKQIKQEPVEKLSNFLALLEKVDGVPLWYATQFYRHTHVQFDATNVAQILEALAQDYTETNQEFMLFIESIRDNIIAAHVAMKQKLDSVSEFEKFWQTLHQLLIFPLTNDQFIGEFAQASFLSKLLLCKELSKVVDAIDESIKMMKSSHALNFDEKKQLFNLMLRDFFALCKRWLTGIMPEHALIYHSNWSLQRYLRQLDYLFNGIMNLPPSLPEDLYFQKSAGFSVQAAILGSNTAFNRHYPGTPEDLFMLIHQNSLIAVSATYKSLFSGNTLSNVLYMPAVFRVLFEHIDTNNIPKSLIGIVYDDTKMGLLYNMPLDNHSATFQLVYSFITQEITLQVQYLGQARNRWEQIAVLAAASPEFSGVMLDGPIIFDWAGGIVIVTWKVDSVNALAMLMEYLKIMNSISFNDIWWISLATINKTNEPQADVIQKILPLCATRIKGTLQQNWEAILSGMRQHAFAM
jgi:hypothetical protein